MMVMANELGDAIAGVLAEYSRDVQDKLRKIVDASMRELVTTTRKTAPRRKSGIGHYYKQIASKLTLDTDSGYARTWYVKRPDYRLTHLLEFGHQKINGGRVEGTHFLQKAVTQVTEKYLQQVEEAVSGG